MQRTPLVLISLVAVLSGALAMFWLKPAAVATDETAIRTIVSQMLAEHDAQNVPATQPVPPVETAEISQDLINPMIESYLMGDPKILQRVTTALQAQLREEETVQARLNLVNFESEIYDDPGHVVLGNPDGDITLVEFFDYNCGFCRRAMPDMAQLIAEDPNLRIILKEFPILSENSVDAARVAVAVANTPDADYWAFHELLFTSRGQISGETALDAAEQIGMSRVSVELDMRSEAVASVLQRSYTLAQGLNITGTPAYIIGDEIIPGAVGVEALRQSIANMRKCGSTICDT